MLVLFTAVTEKRRACFINNCGRLARFGIHTDDAKDLVPTLIVGKCEATGVMFPADRNLVIHFEWVGKKGIIDRNLPCRSNIEKLRSGMWQHIARLEVVVGDDFRLKLVSG